MGLGDNYADNLCKQTNKTTINSSPQNVPFWPTFSLTGVGRSEEMDYRRI